MYCVHYTHLACRAYSLPAMARVYGPINTACLHREDLNPAALSQCVCIRPAAGHPYTYDGRALRLGLVRACTCTIPFLSLLGTPPNAISFSSLELFIVYMTLLSHPPHYFPDAPPPTRPKSDSSEKEAISLWPRPIAATPSHAEAVPS